MRKALLADLETGIRIYYEKFELGNAEIIELFGKMAPSTCSRLKNEILAEMANRGIKQYSKYGVDTKVAYEVWGLDIAEMERRLQRLRKLGLRKEVQ